MSREELSTFINAAEYRISIKQKLSQAKNIQEIINLAKSYGFRITHKDFEEEEISSSIENWFKTSKINPSRNPNKTYQY